MREDLIRGETRKPIAFLTYAPGIETPSPWRYFGPTMQGELLWPVTIERTTEHTKIGVSYVRPPEPATS